MCVFVCVRARKCVCGDFACVHACVSARVCLRSCARVRVRIEVCAYVGACVLYIHESKANRKSRIAPVTVKCVPHIIWNFIIRRVISIAGIIISTCDVATLAVNGNVGRNYLV